ncbi:hypothetical protein N7481_003607 [Penicillium waksmanii]|uniref:uncharacterized protein n=1 Tax=Penicillium waksmanii TaxID=69791 RepID=UPI0025499BA7|nr:uncharacterized protein N7481_003607 [Penicillium waksmanii]KAJ5988397.1 hypothetical protein N7481_003607 [Penicillium waksmanii]
MEIKPIIFRDESTDLPELFTRIEILEEAVLRHTGKSIPGAHRPAASPNTLTSKTPATRLTGTGFGNALSYLSSNQHPHDQSSATLVFAISCLPNLDQTRDLFDHFFDTTHPNFGVLHVPSTRTILEESYHRLRLGKTLEAGTLLLLLSIISSAAFIWTPDLLKKLYITPSEAKDLHVAYSHLALGLLDYDLPPSTAALAGISTLTYLHTNAEGLLDKVHLLRARGLLMARAMRIHCLDTPKSREHRRLNGCDGIEVEVQRRIWWHMVSSDWLLAFSGGPQEGTYIFQKKHMAVQYPSNVDDGTITAKFDPDRVPYDLSCSVPTAMSASIARIRLAEICEEAVNELPFNGLDSSELDYEIVLALDAKFQEYLRDLPSFFQLHPGGVQDTQFRPHENSYISWQRLILHFSAHTRLCWLHRRFHLESSVNKRYAYSREAGIRSARMVLELRRLMDDAGPLVSINPCRLWSLMQHVFHAAILLASDFSLYPTSPDATTRQQEVMAACRILEQSASEVDGTHRVVQKLRATLKERKLKNVPSATINPSSLIPREHAPGGSVPTAVDSPVMRYKEETSPLPSHSDDFSPSPLDKLWSEFVDAAPEMDLDLWTSLLDEIDGTLSAEPLGGLWGGFENTI